MTAAPMASEHPARTILTVLAERVRDRPDKLFLRFRDHDLTYAQFDRRTRSLAGGLRRHRVADAGPDPESLRILPSLLPNCADGIALWFASNRIDIVWAPLNTEFRGDGLAHAINLTGCRDLVVDDSLLDPVLEIGDALHHVERLFVRGTSTPSSSTAGGRSFEVLSLEQLDGAVDAVPPSSPLPGDPSLLIYTSGTTGMSKACELSHHYVVEQAGMLARSLGLREDDVAFCPYPIFHWDATLGTIVPALLSGATAIVTERFSVSSFWEDVRHFGVTIFDFMGATLTWLHQQEARPNDADNPARIGWGIPMPAFKADFERRFGLVLVEGYGSTEGGVMAFQAPGEPYPIGSCGRAVPEYQIRIVDEGDSPLDPGGIGEIVVKPAGDRSRYLMMSGYYRMPEVNAEAFRGGWFHTGDLGRLDTQGNLYFEGRQKDDDQAAGREHFGLRDREGDRIASVGAGGRCFRGAE